MRKAVDALIPSHQLLIKHVYTRIFIYIYTYIYIYIYTYVYIHTHICTSQLGDREEEVHKALHGLMPLDQVLMKHIRWFQKGWLAATKRHGFSFNEVCTNTASLTRLLVQ